MSAEVMEAPARTEHTDSELRVAWAKCRASSWPATFEETMRDPLRAQSVHAMASWIARRRTVAPAAPPAKLDEHTCRIHQAACTDVRPSRRCANCMLRPSTARFTPPPGYIDRKRAAAGDRDDD